MCVPGVTCTNALTVKKISMHPGLLYLSKPVWLIFGCTWWLATFVPECIFFLCLHSVHIILLFSLSCMLSYYSIILLFLFYV